MKKIKNLILFLFFLLPFIMVKPALAGFGISPAEIYNDSLKPGSSFEKEIVLSRSDAEENLKIIIETDLNETESWFKFEPSKEFIIPKGQNRKIIKVIVSVPNNAELKNYKGILRIKASSADSSNSGVSIVQGARMDVTLVTTSINVDLLNIKGLNIPNVEFQQPIKLLINVENNGNTESSPSKIIFEIQSLNQNTIETQEVSKLEKISPNTTKEITAEFKNSLDSGEYFAIIKVYLGDKLLRSDRLVFKVNPPLEGYNPATPSNNIFTKIISTIKQNKVETGGVIAIIVLPIIVGLFVYKFGVFLFIKKIFLVGTIVYIIIVSALLYLFHQNRLLNLTKPGDQGNVQGEILEITSTAAPNLDSGANLTVNQETAGYPIYRLPNKNSPVVYTATENEKLNVVSENDSWYQISTGNGTGGWLPKTSVKKTE